MTTKYIAALLFLCKSLCFCADNVIVEFTEMHRDDFFYALDRVAQDSENKMAGFHFELLLAQNPSIKLDLLQKQDLAETIIMDQANRRGAHMLVALHDYQGIDYNAFTITNRYQYPLAFATRQMLRNRKNGVHLVDALIDCGASVEMEAGFSGNREQKLNMFWLGSALQELKEKSLEKTEKAKRAEAGITLMMASQVKNLDDSFPISVHIYRALRKGLIEPKRSHFKNLRWIEEDSISGKHICSCKHCGLAFE